MLNLTSHLRRIASRIRTIVDSQTGASMVEYAFLVSLIAIVALIAVALFGSNLSDTYDGIASSI